MVALLAEGVDRNVEKYLPETGKGVVALLAEGVDRNIVLGKHGSYPPAVALLAEGVDRNALHPDDGRCALRSPSSRRAWIEMVTACCLSSLASVALLAEGVDRNYPLNVTTLCPWVALLAEGVDRNFERPGGFVEIIIRRPPRGGRG